METNSSRELACLNRVELNGVVGAVKTDIAGEHKRVRFSVATNYAYKDREGCAVIETTWHNCTVWEGRRVPREQLDKLTKGAKVHLLGRLRNTSYTAEDGTERTAAEVVVSELEVFGTEASMKFEV